MDNDLFLEAQTNQYGSHMVMTNVNKPIKKKLVNIDTTFRDEYNYNDSAIISNITSPERLRYNITLSDRLTSIKTMSLRTAEIPMTFYNISSNLGNNSITITNTGTNAITSVLVPDGYYASFSAVIAAINLLLPATLTLSTSSAYKYQFNSTSSTNFSVNFLNINQSANRALFKYSLGWLLGFRNPLILVNAGTSVGATYVVPMLRPSTKYLYVAIDDFSKGGQNSFLTPTANSIINKNVIARISVDNATYGDILVANQYNGLLVSDVRCFSGKIDIQKLNIQLLHENGIPVDLNGNDFAFCLEVSHE